jgi:hypothetical protein
MVHCLRNPQQSRDTFAIPQEEEYEIGICIQTGDIVWENGPFKCMLWPDLLIYTRDLKQKLRAGEMVEADSGYRGDTMIMNADVFFWRSDLRAKEIERSRHKMVNRAF